MKTKQWSDTVTRCDNCCQMSEFLLGELFCTLFSEKLRTKPSIAQLQYSAGSMAQAQARHPGRSWQDMDLMSDILGNG